MIGLALMVLAAASPADTCMSVRAALPQAGACVADADGIALATDEAAARALLDQAHVGAERFRAVFRRQPSRYAVFSFDDPSTVPSTSTALQALGFSAVLSLPSATAQQRRMAETIRKLQPAGDKSAAPRIVRRDAPSGTGEPRGASFVPHELGHKWYADAFWPASPSARPAAIRRYGSPAPDWLDEAAAMLMEDDAGKQGYYQRFADGRSTDAQRAATVPPEIPLATLTGMDHPALAGMPMPGVAGGPVSFTVTSKPSLFYAEARVFADYLIERSGEPHILAVVSDGLKDGTTFEGWLGTQGGHHRLPASLSVMQADWESWLDRRFGAGVPER